MSAMPPRSPDFDLVVLGGGSGGLAAAFRAAQHGARVALLEPGPRDAPPLPADAAEVVAVVPAEMLLGELGVGYLTWIECNNLHIAGILFAILVIGAVGVALVVRL